MIEINVCVCRYSNAAITDTYFLAWSLRGLKSKEIP